MGYLILLIKLSKVDKSWNFIGRSPQHGERVSER